MGSKLDALKALAAKAEDGKLTTYHAFMDSCSPDTLLALIASCEELAAALEKHQWNGRCGMEGEYHCCPECNAIDPNDFEFKDGVHTEDCSIGAALTRHAERWGTEAAAKGIGGA